MIRTLQRLKHHGYIPDTVLDIGACHGTWTQECRHVYPDANYLMFEPICYPELERIKNTNPNTLVFHALLDSEEREVEWYEKQNTGDSMFRERTHHFKDCSPIIKKTTTLGSIIDTYLPTMKNVLIKIDSQGAEIPILKGAGEILKKTDCILLEIPFFGQYNENVPSFLEHIKFMDDLGFVPFDIPDIHYVREFVIQIDMIFISKNHPLVQRVQDVLMEH